MNLKYKLLLASKSPRRHELLKLLDPNFEMAEPREVEEVFPADLPVDKIPEYLSRLKAEAYSDYVKPGEILITADTIVVNNGKVLGKPHTPAEAVDMLKALRGHSHTVITGVTLCLEGKCDTFSEHTEVTFDHISDEEIELYVEKFRPLDKAGAYGIQEWIGGIGISGINGCFYNVMGLPLHTLYLHLKNF